MVVKIDNYYFNPEHVSALHKYKGCDDMTEIWIGRASYVVKANMDEVARTINWKNNFS